MAEVGTAGGIKPVISEEGVKSQHEFNFPLQPYNIQLDLMKSIYKSLQERKFALVESPTGTGKSLSLICSSITWLRDYQKRVREELERQREDLTLQIEKLREEEDNSGDWLTAQTRRKDVTRNLDEINHELERLMKFERRSEVRQHAKLFDIPLENYLAFQAKALECDKNVKIHEIDKSAFLLRNVEEGTKDDNETEPELDIEKKVANQEEDQVRPKLYYASRTHSQLTQFVNEIRKTNFASSSETPPIKVVPLASRANMCINQEVLRLRDPNAINEKCTEMSRESNKDKKCPYAKSKSVNLLKESILTSVQDIEDIARQGRYLGACPYYASRLSVTEAEVVVLPYNNLLHHETRKASNLDLKESIVLIDEAHNILETICSIHSSSITGQHLISAHTILSRYYKKFHNRMSAKNAEMIKHIVSCLTALIKFLNDPLTHLKDYDNPKAIDLDTRGESVSGEENAISSGDKFQETMIDVTRFVGASTIERFNIFKIIDYFDRSQLSRKLIGFFKQDCSIDLTLELSEDLENKNNPKKCDRSTPALKKRKISNLQQNNCYRAADESHQKKDSLSTSISFLVASNPELKPGKDCLISSYPVYILVEFLRSLTNLTEDGRVLVNIVRNNIQKSSLKFVLLNPSSQFQQMAKESRSIVLAGGTMQPFSEFLDLLFKPLGVDKEQMTLFSCGHVIKPEQLLISTLSVGPTGRPLELSFKTRSNFETVDEIGRSILGISSLVPGGVICFLPSYDYEQFCYNRWTQMGFIKAIESKSKRVFREPRQATHMKATWDEYVRTIESGRSSKKGALMFCVVGGKMSEGINFNDDLGRCVIMVGLPYANIKSIELQQKMAYYDRTCKRGSSSAGQEYYENLCIKGLNQSIGRAVRHKNDYAAIVLIDRRYATKQTIRNGLPLWIGKSLKDQNQIGSLLSHLKSFYDSMEQQK